MTDYSFWIPKSITAFLDFHSHDSSASVCLPVTMQVLEGKYSLCPWFI